MGITINDVESNEHEVILLGESRSSFASCPSCGVVSHRCHSRYQRQLLDLPFDGRTVTLQLTARRFFCNEPECERRIFTERLPKLVRPYGRCTVRLEDLVRRIGIVAGGEPGVRLTDALKVPISSDTILRLVCRLGTSYSLSPRVIGVDEWAWRRGRRYGTILCDLERRRPIDLLTDASSQSFATWLRQHPDVKIISRDRSGMFSLGAAEGAPKAIQVADRWHLLKNLGDGLERYLSSIPVPGAILPGPKDVEEDASANVEISAREMDKQARRARRKERFETVLRLYKQTGSVREVARITGLSRKTVTNYIKSGTFPERRPRARQPGILDPFMEYIHHRWSKGCHNSHQIFLEIKSKGYGGSATTVRAYVAKLRAGKPIQKRPQERRPSPRDLRWLLSRPVDQLDTQEIGYLETLFEQHPKAQQVYKLVQDFIIMIKEQRRDSLDDWLAAAEKSQIRFLTSFARGILRDYDAVAAALQYPWSNGQVEGHVNRLKMLKRQMYGRAGINLLRSRFLGT